MPGRPLTGTEASASPRTRLRRKQAADRRPRGAQPQGGVYEPHENPPSVNEDDDMSEEIKAVDEQTEELSERQKEQKKLKKKLKRSERSVKDYQFFALRLLILILLIWVLFFQIVGVMRMPSGDMYPRIDSGDLVLYYRLDKNVRAQDIIVLEASLPNSADTDTFICRVVAVAGDTVEITDAGRLMVNGSTMLESNIFYSTPRYEGFTEYPLTLGEGQCFVLADMRNGGADSRYFGPVDRSQIAGTVITIVRRNNL